MPIAPKILRKPSVRLHPEAREPYDWIPLSNSEEHHGKKVKMTFPSKYLGKLGHITRADTAHNGSYRSLYVTVELEDVILTEVVWDDFVQVHT